MAHASLQQPMLDVFLVLIQEFKDLGISDFGLRGLKSRIQRDACVGCANVVMRLC